MNCTILSTTHNISIGSNQPGAFGGGGMNSVPKSTIGSSAPKKMGSGSPSKSFGASAMDSKQSVDGIKGGSSSGGFTMKSSMDGMKSESGNTKSFGSTSIGVKQSASGFGGGPSSSLKGESPSKGTFTMKGSMDGMKAGSGSSSKSFGSTSMENKLTGGLGKGASASAFTMTKGKDGMKSGNPKSFGTSVDNKQPGGGFGGATLKGASPSKGTFTMKGSMDGIKEVNPKSFGDMSVDNKPPPAGFGSGGGLKGAPSSGAFTMKGSMDGMKSGPGSSQKSFGSTPSGGGFGSGPGSTMKGGPSASGAFAMKGSIKSGAFRAPVDKSGMTDGPDTGKAPGSSFTMKGSNVSKQKGGTMSERMASVMSNSSAFSSGQKKKADPWLKGSSTQSQGGSPGASMPKQGLLNKSMGQPSTNIPKQISFGNAPMKGSSQSVGGQGQPERKSSEGQNKTFGAQSINSQMLGGFANTSPGSGFAKQSMSSFREGDLSSESYPTQDYGESQNYENQTPSDDYYTENSSSGSMRDFRGG